MIVDNGKYYLYRHVRLDTNEVFYIGKGTKRVTQLNTMNPSAYSRAIDTRNRTNYWYNITSKSLFEVDILLESNNKEFIDSKEIEFISLYGRVDLGKGSLVNLVDGGTFYKNKSIKSIEKTVMTKRAKGNIGNFANLKNYMNSDNFVGGMAKTVYVYKLDGGLFNKYDTISKAANFLKGNPWWVGQQAAKCKITNGYILKNLGFSISPTGLVAVTGSN